LGRGDLHPVAEDEMPSMMPTSGSPAEMAGRDSWIGPALNALCINQRPIAPVPSSAYGA